MSVGRPDSFNNLCCGWFYTEVDGLRYRLITMPTVLRCSFCLKAWLHCRLFMSRRRRCVEFAVKRLNGLIMYLSVLQSSIRSSNDLFPLARYCTALNSAFYWSQVTECLLCCFLRRHLTSWTSRFIWQVPFLDPVWSNRPELAWQNRLESPCDRLEHTSNWKIAISITISPALAKKSQAVRAVLTACKNK